MIAVAAYFRAPLAGTILAMETPFRRDLDGTVLLPAGQPDWQPAEFLIAVTPAGLLGRPVETVSSDVEDVDVFFRDYLARTLRLGERLPPGFYRVVVGP